MKNKWIICCLLFLSIFKNIDAQQYTTFFPSPINEQLFQNTITGVNKDQYGYLWITSQFGIYCYDGFNLIQFNSANNKELKSNRFSGIYTIGNDQKLYTLDELNEVYVLENKTIKHIVLPIKYNYLFLYNRIIVDFSNKFKSHIELAYHYKQLIPSKKYKVHFNQNQISITETLNTIKVHTQNKEINIPFLSKFQILSLGPKFLILKIDNRIFCYTLSQLELKFQILLSNTFDSELITSYYDEISNIIYCGTFNNGLIQLSPNAIQRFTTSQNPENYAYLYSYAYDSASNLIFAILDDGVYQWQYRMPNHTSVKIESGKWSGSVCSISNDRELFYSCNEKLTCYSISSGKKKYQIHCKHEIKDFFKFQNKTYFISDNSLFQFNNKLFWEIKRFPYITHFYKVKIHNNLIYLCSDIGVVVLNSNLEIVKQYLKNKTVRDIQFYKSNIIAATYGDGVFVVNNGREIRIPNDSKNQMLASLALRKDNTNRFWIICNKGIFIIPEINFSNLRFDSTNYLSLNIHSDLPATELNGGVYPENFQIIANKIIIPSNHGLLQIKQEYEIKDNINLNVYLGNIVVNNNLNLGSKKKIILPYDHTSLDIAVITQYFQIGKPLPIYYKLKNIDGNWQRLSNNRSIKFSRLPPGNYSLIILQNNRELKLLEIKVMPVWYATWWFILLVILCTALIIGYIFIRNQRRVKEEKENLDLLVNHKTFELQYTVAELTRAQNNLKEENNFKNQLYAILMHDIKSPLMFLAESSFLIYNKHKNEKNDLTNIVRIAANTSKELHDFISDFLNWLGTQFVDYHVEIHPVQIENVISDLVKFYQPIANSKGLVILTNDEENNITINSNATILQTIIRNFIDNAIKYTSKGEINITTLEENDRVKIVITDSGDGLPQEIVNLIKDWETQKLTEAMIGHSSTHKMGIKITLEFIKLLNGEISYIEKNPNGSTIQISLKKDIILT